LKSFTMASKRKRVAKVDETIQTVDENEECAICFTKVKDMEEADTDPVVSAICKCPIVYCKKCLLTSFQYDAKCSICRKIFRATRGKTPYLNVNITQNDDSSSDSDSGPHRQQAQPGEVAQFFQQQLSQQLESNNLRRAQEDDEGESLRLVEQLEEIERMEEAARLEQLDQEEKRNIEIAQRMFRDEELSQEQRREQEARDAETAERLHREWLTNRNETPVIIDLID